MLPTTHQITEEMLLALRDQSAPVVCAQCSGDRGVLIGDRRVELYSPHYTDLVRVWGCPRSCIAGDAGAR
jgi:hypothetical protein